MARPKLTEEQRQISKERRKKQFALRDRRLLHNCKECGGEFIVKKGCKRPSNWCEKCRFVLLKCKKCGINFEIERRFFNFRGASFCSLDCSRKNTLFTQESMAKEKHPNWKGGINSVIARRARLAKVTGSHTLSEWEALKMKNRYICLCCKKCEPEVKLEEDHIVPLSKGGSNDIKNIQPLCRSCNARKHDKHIDYLSFYQLKKLNYD